MTLVEKLNLLWKFLFLAVFSYGVISLTCCSKQTSCKRSCQTNQVDTKAQVDTKSCPIGCTKKCCA